jgi:hypothetical protein
MYEEGPKVDEYFSLIQDRIVSPIENTEVRQSCTATLLLLFAAIDGLGGLLHSKSDAGSNARIRSFLDYMGGDYAAKKKQLLKLRNGLVHTAVNVESFLSKTEMTVGQHLKCVGSSGFLYVNTAVMYSDFVTSFAKFRGDLATDSALMERASSRLEWKEDQTWDETAGPMPSPPPPVEFILLRTRGA